MAKKLRTIAGVLGLAELKAMNFTSYDDFITKQTRLGPVNTIAKAD